MATQVLENTGLGLNQIPKVLAGLSLIRRLPAPLMWGLVAVGVSAWFLSRRSSAQGLSRGETNPPGTGLSLPQGQDY